VATWSQQGGKKPVGDWATGKKPVGENPLAFLGASVPRVAICDLRVTIAAAMADQNLLPVERIERAILVLHGHEVDLLRRHFGTRLTLGQPGDLCRELVNGVTLDLPE
jgi:hypothetical protein